MIVVFSVEMRRDPKHLSLHARDREITMLEALKRLFTREISRVRPDPELIIGNMKAENMIRMSRHILLHYTIQFCYINRSRFVHILADMLSRSYVDMERYIEDGNLSELDRLQPPEQPLSDDDFKKLFAEVMEGME